MNLLFLYLFELTVRGEEAVCDYFMEETVLPPESS